MREIKGTRKLSLKSVSYSLHFPSLFTMKNLTNDHWNKIIFELNKWMKRNKALNVEKIIINPNDIEIIYK
jgi:hypothetical protein